MNLKGLSANTSLEIPARSPNAITNITLMQIIPFHNVCLTDMCLTHLFQTSNFVHSVSLLSVLSVF